MAGGDYGRRETLGTGAIVGGGTARDFKTGESGSNYRDYEHAERRVVHPMARTHPATGRKSLYAVTGFTYGIEGMEDEDARELMAGSEIST